MDAVSEIHNALRRLSRRELSDLILRLNVKVAADPCDPAARAFPVRGVISFGESLLLSRRHPDDSKRLRSPDGDTYNISNVAAFASQHGLTSSQVYALLNGRRRTALGWTNPDIAATKPGLLLRSPDGEIHAVEPTLASFCRRHGLQSPNVIALRKGTIKKHKGWTLVRNTV